MPGFLRILSSRAVPVVRGHSVSQTANMYSKAAKDKIGTVETSVGLALFTAAILGPSGWILAHLEDYKKKD